VATGEAEMSDADKVRAAASRALSEVDPRTTARSEYLRRWFENGLTWVHFPVGLGGMGVSRKLQPVADEMLIEAGGEHPRSNDRIGYGVAAPTLVAFGQPELARELVRGIATGEQVWCQLFSEPEAGSDLANVMTAASRDDGDGDGWIVNGQKVWSSRGQFADWGVLLARTDPDKPKHQGLTFFVIDMHQPGVDVRPLRQITGQAEFNEVFLTDVALADRQRLGEVGEGWKVARATLANERMGIADRHGEGGPSALADLLGAWDEHAGAHTPQLAQSVAQLWVDAEVHRVSCDRFRAMAAAGAAPGQEAAIAKLVGAELNQRAYDLCMDLLGLEAGLYDSFDQDATPDPDRILQRRFLRSRANTIEGGASEILRNVISERILGLPPEPRADRDISWRELRRRHPSAPSAAGGTP
jgi:alkylation response protein AidB-like acyl-CoA dehydrogenase